MNPSSVRLTTPARSAIAPPAAANRYGTAMRRVCARKSSALTLRRLPPGHRAAQEPPHLGHGRRDREDHDALQHLDHLLRHHRVDREPALRERREEERGEHDAERIVAADERDRDAEEARAAGEAVLVVVLVAEHVVDAAHSGERAAQRERPEPDATGTPAYSAASGCSPTARSS